MPLSDAQIDKFVVLWKNATCEDVSSEEAKQIAARLIHLYRMLVVLPENPYVAEKVPDLVR